MRISYGRTIIIALLLICRTGFADKCIDRSLSIPYNGISVDGVKYEKCIRENVYLMSVEETKTINCANVEFYVGKIEGNEESWRSVNSAHLFSVPTRVIESLTMYLKIGEEQKLRLVSYKKKCDEERKIIERKERAEFIQKIENKNLNCEIDIKCKTRAYSSVICKLKEEEKENLEAIKQEYLDSKIAGLVDRKYLYDLQSEVAYTRKLIKLAKENIKSPMDCKKLDRNENPEYVLKIRRELEE